MSQLVENSKTRYSADVYELASEGRSDALIRLPFPADRFPYDIPSTQPPQPRFPPCLASASLPSASARLLISRLPPDLSLTRHSKHDPAQHKPRSKCLQEQHIVWADAVDNNDSGRWSHLVNWRPERSARPGLVCPAICPAPLRSSAANVVTGQCVPQLLQG